MLRPLYIIAAMACSATLFTSAVIAPAFADENLPTVRTARDRVEVRIGYGDLNLSNDQGVAALNRRVRNAAKTLCSESGHSFIGGLSLQNACQYQTMEDARPQIASAVARYRSREFASLRPIRLTVR